MADEKQNSLSPGWVLVDEAFLSPHRVELSDPEVLRFFDGRVPNWRYALSGRIPPRQMVFDLVDALARAIERGRMQVTVLLGAGGEGKSTILRQTAMKFVEKNSSWKVLWHEDVEQRLSREWNPAEGVDGWLVVSDDADFIAADVARVVKTLHNRGRNNVHFLLAARHTDWYAARGDKQPWSAYCDFSPVNLRGLSEHDAGLIVSAWGALGKAGLGKLSALQEDEAARQLFKTARLESTTPEGSFLGAMLRLRFGQDLEAHVLDLLNRLHEIQGVSYRGSLAHAFSYIVGPHALNVLTLSRPILAEAIGCAPRDLNRSARISNI